MTTRTTTDRVITFMRRYAPLLAVGVALLLLIVLTPSRPVQTVDSLGADTSRGQDLGTSGSAVPGGSATGTASTAPTAGPGGGRTGSTGAAGAGGTTGVVSGGGSTTSGGVQPNGKPLPCTPRPYNVALPCKPGWAGGTNGGATAHNVQPNKLVVVWYVTYVDDTTRQIQAQSGSAYSKEQIDADTAALQSYARKYWQTFGRQIQFITYYGSHAVTDDAGLKAEAVEIDTKIHAFAVAATQTPVALATELARRGVVAFNTYQQTNAYYAAHAPFEYSVFGDADLLNSFTAEYIGKRLKGRPAQFGGTGTNSKIRKFGVAYEQIQEAAGRDLISRLKAQGVDPVVATFGSDISTAQQGAINIVTQFKSAGVTTVLIIGNPFAPLFLTENSDTQQYYPEYLITGYQQQDTEEAARLYSKTQWNHAFGFTQLALRGPFEQGQSYKAAKLGNPSYTPSKNVVGEFLAMQQILNGVERSGPQLTPSGFQAALRGIPATNPTPDYPRLSYGSAGPGPYTARDDVAEIWWDPNTTKSFDGKAGAYVRVHGGARVQLGQFPTTVPAVFR